MYELTVYWSETYLLDLSKDLLVTTDLLVITETKMGSTFPVSEFHIDGFSIPYRLDRNSNGGGVIVYFREDIFWIL